MNYRNAILKSKHWKLGGVCGTPAAGARIKSLR